MLKNKIIGKKIRNIIVLLMAIIVMIGAYRYIDRSRAEKVIEIDAIALDNYGYLEDEEFKLEAKQLDDGSYEIELPENVNTKKINRIVEIGDGLELVENRIYLTKEQIENEKISIEVEYDVKELEAEKLYNKILKYEDKENGKVVELRGYLPVDAELQVEEVSQEQLTEIFGEKKIKVAYDIKILQKVITEVPADEAAPDAKLTQIVETIEINPEDYGEKCEVSIKDINIGENSKVYHVKEDNSYEQVNVTESTEGNVSFEAQSFSIYAVIDGEIEVNSGENTGTIGDEIIPDEGIATGVTDNITPTISLNGIQVSGGEVSTTVEPITASLYGEYVENYVPQNGSNVGWKILYADEDNIYLIADDYVGAQYIPTGKNGSVVSVDSSKNRAVSLWPACDDYNGWTDIQSSSAIKWFSQLTAISNLSTNAMGLYNMKLTAYLADDNQWAGFTNSTYADYAIGGVPVELFVASYNATHTDLQIQTQAAQTASEIAGYTFKWDYDSSYSPSIKYIDSKDGLYGIVNTTYADGGWLASPCGSFEYNGIATYYETQYSSVSTAWPTYTSYYGIRPVVCIKSEYNRVIDSDGNGRYELINDANESNTQVNATNISGDWSKSHTVQVTIGDDTGLKTGANLKYAWSTSNTIEPTSWTDLTFSYSNGATSASTNITKNTDTLTYYLWIKSNNLLDTSNNSNKQTIVTGAFKFDNMVPTAGVISANKLYTNQSNVTLYVNEPSDTHSGLNYVKIDGWYGAWATGSKNVVAIYDSTNNRYYATMNFADIPNSSTGVINQGEGIYTFKGSAVDNVGNISKTEDLNVVYDITAPTAATMTMKIGSSSGSDYINNTVTKNSVYIALNNDASDALSGVDSSTYTVKKDGVTYLSDQTIARTLTEGGTYTITVTTKDKAGNIGTREYTVKIDKIPPVWSTQNFAVDVENNRATIDIIGTDALTEVTTDGASLTTDGITVYVNGEKADSIVKELSEVTAITGGIKYTLTLSNWEETTNQAGRLYKEWSGSTTIQINAGTMTDVAGNASEQQELTVGNVDFIKPEFVYEASNTIIGDGNHGNTKKVTVVFDVVDKYFSNTDLATDTNADLITVKVDSDIVNGTVNVTKTLTKKNDIIINTQTNAVTYQATGYTPGTNERKIGERYELLIEGLEQLDANGISNGYTYSGPMSIAFPSGKVTDLSGNVNDATTITIAGDGTDGNPGLDTGIKPSEIFDQVGTNPDGLHIGDFVNYDAGTWTQAEIDAIQTGLKTDLKTANGSTSLPNQGFQFGGFTAGSSRNGNATPYSSTYNYVQEKISENQTTAITGWRVFDVEGDKVTLISAGNPEDYYHPGSTKDAYRSEYILAGDVNSKWSTAEAESYQIRDWSNYVNTVQKGESATALTKSKLDSWYTKYTNTPNANTFTEENFQKIYTDTTYQKYQNMIENYSYYWLSTANGSGYVFDVYPGGRNVGYSGYIAFGVRVLVTLSSDVQFTATKTGTKTVTGGNTSQYGGEQTYNVWDIKQANTPDTGDLPSTSYTMPYLPDGYSYVEGNLNTGLVIADPLGNEYVWVEVPRTTEVYPTAGLNLDLNNLTGTELTNAYNAIETDLHTYTDTYRNGTTFTDTYSGDDASTGLTETQYNELKQKMLRSIYQNGGFYVGRYETGIENTPKTSGSTTGIPTEIAVIKQNAYPYNNVTCSQAQAVASRFASQLDGYTSSLMFGVQWDLILRYFETKGATQSELITDSTNWGNYYNNNWTITNINSKYKKNGNSWVSGLYNGTGNKGDTSTPIILSTGASDTFSKQGIYDLAGNVWELTLEYASDLGSPCTNRGGVDGHSGHIYPANTRDRCNTTAYYYNIGFRTVLYKDTAIEPESDVPEIVDVVDPVWELGDVDLDAGTIKLIAKDKYFDECTIDENKITIYTNEIESTTIVKDITSIAPTNVLDTVGGVETVVGKEYTLQLSNITPAIGGDTTLTTTNLTDEEGYTIFTPANLTTDQLNNTVGFKYRDENGGGILIKIAAGTIKDKSGNTSREQEFSVGIMDASKVEVYDVQKIQDAAANTDTFVFNVTDRNYAPSDLITKEEITVWVDGEQVDSIQKTSLTNKPIKLDIDGEVGKVLGHQYTLVLSNIVETLKQTGNSYLEWSGTLEIKIAETAAKDINGNTLNPETTTISDFVDYIKPEFIYEAANTIIGDGNHGNTKKVTVVFDVIDKYFNNTDLATDTNADLITVKVDNDIVNGAVNVTKTLTKKNDIILNTQTKAVTYKATGYTLGENERKIGERYELLVEGLEQLDANGISNGYTYSGPMSIAFPTGKVTDLSGNVNDATTITIGVDETDRNPNTGDLPSTSYTTPYLPEGYSYVEGDLNTGLVIADPLGNEYVWVEVPRTTEVYPTAGLNLDLNNLTGTELTNAYNSIETDLHTYTNTYRNGTTYTDTYYSDETTGLTETQYNELKQKMLRSIYQSGGFYVGRYETGIENAPKTSGSTTGIPTEIAVIKQNAYPYNNVTCSQAQAVASRFASQLDGYTSSLMFGVQWDLVLKYLETKGATQSELITDSTDWGNYYNNLWTITNENSKYTEDGTNWSNSLYNGNGHKNANRGIILSTGASDTFSKQGIYDLAGNVWERTLEYSSITDNPCTNRAGCGNYMNNGYTYPASFRDSWTTTDYYFDIGFRTVLYKDTAIYPDSDEPTIVDVVNPVWELGDVDLDAGTIKLIAKDKYFDECTIDETKITVYANGIESTAIVKDITSIPPTNIYDTVNGVETVVGKEYTLQLSNITLAGGEYTTFTPTNLIPDELNNTVGFKYKSENGGEISIKIAAGAIKDQSGNTSREQEFSVGIIDESKVEVYDVQKIQDAAANTDTFVFNVTDRNYDPSDLIELNEITVWVDGEQVDSIQKTSLTNKPIKLDIDGETGKILGHQYTLVLSNIVETLKQTENSYLEWSGTLEIKIAETAAKDINGNTLNPETTTISDFVDYIKPEFIYEAANTTIGDGNHGNTKKVTVVFEIIDKYFSNTELATDTNADLITVKVDNDIVNGTVNVTKTLTKKNDIIINTQTDETTYQATGYTPGTNERKIGERYELLVEGLEQLDANGISNGYTYSGPMSIAFPSGKVTDLSGNVNAATTITIGVDGTDENAQDENGTIVDVVDPAWELGDVDLEAGTIKLKAKDKYFEECTIGENKITVYVNGIESTAIVKDITSIPPTNIYDTVNGVETVVGKEYTLQLSNITPGVEGYITFTPTNLTTDSLNNNAGFKYKSENGGEISIKITAGTIKDQSGNASREQEFSVGIMDESNVEVYEVQKIQNAAANTETFIFNVTDRNYDAEDLIELNEITLWIDNVQLDSLRNSASLTSKEIKAEIDGTTKVLGHQYTLVIPNIVETLKQEGKSYLEWSGTVEIKIAETAAKDLNGNTLNPEKTTISDFVDYIKPEFIYEATNTIIGDGNHGNTKKVTVVFDVVDKYFNNTDLATDANANLITVKVDNDTVDGTVNVTKTLTQKNDIIINTQTNATTYQATGYTLGENERKIGERYELLVEGLEQLDANGISNGYTYSGPMSIAFPTGKVTDLSGNVNAATTITIGVDETDGNPQDTQDENGTIVDVVDPAWELGDVDLEAGTIKLIAKDKYFDECTIDENKITVYTNGVESTTIVKDILIITPTNIYDTVNGVENTLVGKEYTLRLSNITIVGGDYTTFSPTNLIPDELNNTEEFKYKSENGGDISIKIAAGTIKDKSGNTSREQEFEIGTIDTVKPEVYDVQKIQNATANTETFIFNVTDRNYDAEDLIELDEITVWVDGEQADSIRKTSLTNKPIKLDIDGETGKVLGHQYTLVLSNIVESLKQIGKNYLEWSGTLEIRIATTAAKDLKGNTLNTETTTISDFVDYIKPEFIYNDSNTIVGDGNHGNTKKVTVIFDVIDKYFNSTDLSTDTNANLITIKVDNETVNQTVNVSKTLTQKNDIILNTRTNAVTYKAAGYTLGVNERKIGERYELLVEGLEQLDANGISNGYTYSGPMSIIFPSGKVTDLSGNVNDATAIVIGIDGTGEDTNATTYVKPSEIFDGDGTNSDGLHIGDFVNYDAGIWTQAEIDAIEVGPKDALVVANGSTSLPNELFQFGGFAAGSSRNGNATPYKKTYDYIKDSTTNDAITGWRVFDIDGDKITLISAGNPEDYCYMYNANDDEYKSEYILSGNINSDWSASEAEAYQNRDWGVYVNTAQKAENATVLTESILNSWYTKYIGIQNASVSVANHFKKIYQSPYTKYQNMIDNNSYYWLATVCTVSGHHYLYNVNPYGMNVVYRKHWRIGCACFSYSII